MSALDSERRSLVPSLKPGLCDRVLEVRTGLLDTTMDRYLQLMEEPTIACMQVVMRQLVPLHLTARDDDREVVSPPLDAQNLLPPIELLVAQNTYTATCIDPCLHLHNNPHISCPSWQSWPSPDKKSAEENGTAHPQQYCVCFRRNLNLYT
jgi:hypothetical protein